MEDSVAPYVFALVVTALLLFLAVFYVVTFSDLECDYINGNTCCERLNRIVIPEVVLAGLLSIGFLVYGYFGSLVYSIPILAWLIYRIMMKPRSNISYYDPAEIYNRSQLKKYTYESISKLIYHLVGFFVFLYSMVMVLIEDDPNDGKIPFPFPHEGM